MDEPVPMEIDEPEEYVQVSHALEPMPAPSQEDRTVIDGRTYFNISAFMDSELPESGSASEGETTSDVSISDEEESTEAETAISDSDSEPENAQSESSSSQSHPFSPNPVPVSYFLAREDSEEQQTKGKNRRLRFNLHQGRVQVLETELFAPRQPTVTPATRIVAPVTEVRAKVSKPRKKRKPPPAVKAHDYLRNVYQMFEKLVDCPCECFSDADLKDEKVQNQIFRAYGDYHHMSVKERDQEVKHMIRAYVLPKSPNKKSPRQERLVTWEGKPICVNCWCKVHGVGMSTYFQKKKQVWSVVDVCLSRCMPYD